MRPEKYCCIETEVYFGTDSFVVMLTEFSFKMYSFLKTAQ